LEFPDSNVNAIYRLRFGIHDGSGFPYNAFSYDYNGATKQFSLMPPANPNGATWHGIAIDYGTGPNGGRIWRFVTSCVALAAVANARAFAYLLATAAPGLPARTIYIHNHVAYRFPGYYSRIYGDLPFVLAAAGQAPALGLENITFPGPYPNNSLVIRLNFQNRPINFFYSRIFTVVPEQGSHTPMYLSLAHLRAWPPNITMSNVITNDILTLAASLPADHVIQFYKNGVRLANNTTALANIGTFTRLAYGTDNSSYGPPMVPVHRLQIYDRALTDAEHAALHAALVAAET
jgi:hypothetical protein